ncbi:uncharacterized protein K444DRAFT_309750 [Hyaloscypha bicolor E]|uniref:Uncharacterized protein n=1 Tax=Hyaloscypha bicolor E TaxID=1095630 RepID=A0A2J6TMA6_9HELO|nr:uncharacterized protein K444DRAFT_309750 [Hyaloscypha bicolor E]PMD64151.1 hypothetical protein K444DRAFT_309750 [Hyaloscypha bicolor E]
MNTHHRGSYTAPKRWHGYTMGGSLRTEHRVYFRISLMSPLSWEMDWRPHLKARTKNPTRPFQYWQFLDSVLCHARHIFRGHGNCAYYGRVSRCSQCKIEFRIQGSGVEGGKWWVEMVCGKDFGVGKSPFAGSWSDHTVASWPRRMTIRRWEETSNRV